MGSDTEMRMMEDAAAMAYSVYRQTDFETISASRAIDDEFASRIATAALTDSVPQFVERLRRKWGVRSFGKVDSKHISEVLEEYEGDVGKSRKFLRTVRNHPGLVVLEMKNRYVGG